MDVGLGRAHSVGLRTREARAAVASRAAATSRRTPHGGTVSLTCIRPSLRHPALGWVSHTYVLASAVYTSAPTRRHLRCRDCTDVVQWGAIRFFVVCLL